MSFSERFGRRKDPEGKDGSIPREAEKSAQPVPFHAIITGKETPVTEVVARQRAVIEQMLQDDPTGQGKVVVLVDNPLWERSYANDLAGNVARGIPFRQAEREAYRSNWLYVPGKHVRNTEPDDTTIDAAIGSTKSPLSLATGEMLDQIMSEHAGRIIVRAPHTTHGYQMKDVEVIRNNPMRLDMDILSTREQAIEMLRKVLQFQAKSLDERDQHIATSLESAIRDDESIGVVGAIDVNDIGLADSLAAYTDPERRQTVFAVESEYVGGTPTPEALLIERIRRGETIADIEIEATARSNRDFFFGFNNEGIANTPTRDQQNAARIAWINNELTRPDGQLVAELQDIDRQLEQVFTEFVDGKSEPTLEQLNKDIDWDGDEDGPQGPTKSL